MGSVVARHDGNARATHQHLGVRFRPHEPNRFGWWSDECKTGVCDGSREIGILGQEAVTGMNGLCTGGHREGDDLVAP